VDNLGTTIEIASEDEPETVPKPDPITLRRKYKKGGENKISNNI